MHMNVEAAKMRGSDNDEVVDAVGDVIHYLEAEAADKKFWWRWCVRFGRAGVVELSEWSSR